MDILAHLKHTTGDETLAIRGPDCIGSDSGKNYFYKLATEDAAGEEQILGEAESLMLLFSAAPGLAPRLISCQKLKIGTVFVSEYIERRDRGFVQTDFEVLAKRLAMEVHQYQSEKGFGFGIPSYCGATRIVHGWFSTWSDCYSSLIGELLSKLRTKGHRYLDLCDKGREIQERAIPAILGALSVRPVLLHGDLWSGNIALDRRSGRPMIYDPASYFGHNEADLAIAKIFGGFPDSFFVMYHKHFPKTEPVEQYSVRQDLYELFHYLNHTVLFGGGYEQSAKYKMENILNIISKLAITDPIS